MKNTEQNKNQGLPQNSNQNGKTANESRGDNTSQKNNSRELRKEDAGGTGLGHIKDQGKKEDGQTRRK